MQEKIDKLLTSLTPTQLRLLCIEISERYRMGLFPFFTKKEHRLAYLVTRFPATFAVIQEVLRTIPDGSFSSLLDLGAGPGTAWLAAVDLFPSLKKGTLVEQDSEFIRIGKELVSSIAVYLKKDLSQIGEVEAHDLAIFSYSLGEISEKEREQVVGRVWEKTEKTLVMIEPGTQRGFQTILQMRSFLLSKKAHVVAPCPHGGICPMPKEKWCHFSTRLPRSSLHRFAKEGTLPFEDEKYCYVIFSKNSTPSPEARIVSYVQKHSGYVSFTTCNRSGNLEDRVISRKDKELYPLAKKWQWGEEIV